MCACATAGPRLKRNSGVAVIHTCDDNCLGSDAPTICHLSSPATGLVKRRTVVFTQDYNSRE